MGKKLRIGIIGCGSIAQAAALCFVLDPSVEISYCCDNNIVRAEIFARRFRIKEFTSHYHEIITSHKVDALYLAVPHYLHYEMVTEAILAGKPSLCEKPITTTLEDALRIVDLSERTGIKVGVNYQYRYDLAVNQLAEAVEKEMLGKIYYARINVPWYRKPDYFSDWRKDKVQAGGGTLLTQGSHAIDFTQWIIGSRAISAIGMIRKTQNQVEVEDLAMGVLEMENGVLVEVCSSMVAMPEGSIDVQIYTAKGTAQYLNRPFPQAYFTGGCLPLPRIQVSSLFAMQRSLRAFIRWVLGDVEYLIPSRQSIPVLQSVLALYRSAQTGQKEIVNF